MSRVLERPAPAPPRLRPARRRSPLTWTLAALLVLVLGTLAWATPRAARARGAEERALAVRSDAGAAHAVVSDLRAQLDGLRRARLFAGLSATELADLKATLARRIDELRGRIAELEAAYAARSSSGPGESSPPQPIPPPCVTVVIYDGEGNRHEYESCG